MEKETAIVFTKNTKGFVEYSWEDIKTGEHIEQPSVSALSYNTALQSLKNLSGRMLTFIEASTPDKEQRKASKDIIKGLFSEEMNNLANLCFSREYTDKITKEAEENASEGIESLSVDLEDVIKGKV